MSPLPVTRICSNYSDRAILLWSRPIVLATTTLLLEETLDGKFARLFIFNFLKLRILHRLASEIIVETSHPYSLPLSIIHLSTASTLTVYEEIWLSICDVMKRIGGRMNAVLENFLDLL